MKKLILFLFILIISSILFFIFFDFKMICDETKVEVKEEQFKDKNIEEKEIEGKRPNKNEFLIQKYFLGEPILKCIRKKTPIEFHRDFAGMKLAKIQGNTLIVKKKKKKKKYFFLMIPIGQSLFQHSMGKLFVSILECNRINKNIFFQ